MKFSKLSTILTFGLEDKEIEVIKKFEKEFQLNIYSTKEITDLYAIPSFISIVNPLMLNKEELVGLMEEVWTSEDKVLLLKSVENIKFARNVTVVTDLFDNLEKLRLYILSAHQKAKKTEKATKPYSEKLRRLLKIIRLFEKKKYLTSEELVRMFKISKRTLLRDLNLLQAAGEIIVYDKDKKAYRWEK